MTSNTKIESKIADPRVKIVKVSDPATGSEKLNRQIDQANGLLDELSKEQYVSVKTCNRYTWNGIRHNWRKGMFNLSYGEHGLLCNNYGLYLFIVWEDGSIYRIGLVKASDIEFQRQITWSNFFTE